MYSLLEFSDNVAAITEETDEEHPSASELEELTEAADGVNTEEVAQHAGSPYPNATPRRETPFHKRRGPLCG